MATTVASFPCDSKRNLLDVPLASVACTVLPVETFGQRIKTLRISKGWSRPQLGREMAKALERAEAFTGEMIRLYEIGKNRPGKDARKALALVFDKTEQEIEFGSPVQREPASIDSPETVRLLRAFAFLTDEQRRATLKDLESKAATNKAIHKELGTRFEFKSDEEVAFHVGLPPRPPPKKRR